MADNFQLDHVLLPNGVPVQSGTQVVVREKLEYDSGRVYRPGDQITVESLEFTAGNIQVRLEDAPHEILAWEAFVEHIEGGKFVLAEIRG